MIVQCESCQTRFHVADARIPEKGARVRCSRCHHRFHITPSSAAPSAQPGGAPQGSAREPARGDGARAEGRAEGRPEDELDNPEFLFDEKGSEDSQPRTDIDAAAQALREPVQAAPPVASLEPGHGLEPSDAEERVVASGGKTAQEMLDAGAPVLTNTRFELGGELEGDADESDETGTGTGTGTGTREFTLDTEPRATPPRPGPPARAELDALGKELGDDDESSFAGWDPLSPGAASEEGGGKFFDLASAIAGTPGGQTTAAPAAPRSVFDQPDLDTPVAPKKRSAPDVPVFDPEAPSIAAHLLRVAAVVIGIGLVAVAARGLWRHTEADFAPPEIVRADGWVAADVETFLARDALGERVLIVRGNLIPDGSSAAPQVAVRVLGRRGEVLAEAPRTWLERMDDAEVAPDALSLRLASASADVAAIGQQVTGFTAVLPDPPAGARRVEIGLAATPLRPRGTATAETPPLPPAATPMDAAPAPAPAPAVSPPTSHAAPATPPAPGNGDVVPAAPDFID